MSVQDHDEIVRRAHSIWEREGRPEGRAEEHWKMAVAEVAAEAEAKAKAAAATEGEARAEPVGGAEKPKAGPAGSKRAEREPANAPESAAGRKVENQAAKTKTPEDTAKPKPPVEKKSPAEKKPAKSPTKKR